jgi:hypothetical protein
MKGEWKKEVRVEFETVIGYRDAFVAADCTVKGWWDEGRLWGENCYPPEGGWEITDCEGYIEIYDQDGGIVEVIPFTEYGKKLDAEIEFHVEKELQRL